MTQNDINRNIEYKLDRHNKINKIFGILLLINIFFLMLVILFFILFIINLSTGAIISNQNFNDFLGRLGRYNNLSSKDNFSKGKDYLITFALFLSIYGMIQITLYVLSFILLFKNISENNNTYEKNQKRKLTWFLILQILYIMNFWNPLFSILIAYTIFVLNSLANRKEENQFLFFNINNIGLNSKRSIKIFGWSFLIIFVLSIIQGVIIGGVYSLLLNSDKNPLTPTITLLIIFAYINIFIIHYTSYLCLYHQLRNKWVDNLYKSNLFIILQFLMFVLPMFLPFFFIILLMFYIVENKSLNKEEEIQTKKIEKKQENIFIKKVTPTTNSDIKWRPKF
ncbi:hypothetical protein NWE61_01450 [Mycoplasmopsis felis]|uniref:hypothetical protein n=3 Tax=Mycoplasmopsis felis TaxID=33923 RepID=UPI0021AE37EB|nr:hypothetical protein [Mycoplasmopsis felis]MCU9933873.1 hypothetical protein [Mycoplasmopsis felis]UWV80120.1 hypothetical protein NW072_03355 [Mycoplasmopsis felis]